jgi:H+/gluconate symporter-like permease
VKKRQTVGVIISITVSWIMCFGGIDTFCALFTLFPVILTICGSANIPRRYMIGMITCGVSGAACTPGAPLVANSIPMSILGTSSTAGLVPGLVGAFIVLFGGGFYLIRSIHKATDRGEVFEPGNIEFQPVDSSRKYPPFIIALLPLILVVILFNITNTLPLALLFGFLLALVLLTPYIQPRDGMTRGRVLVAELNEGGKSTAEALLLGGIIAGFAAVVQQTDAYNAMIDGVTHLPIPAPLVVVISVAILVGLTGSPPVALQIVVPVLAASLALSPVAIHRIATITASTFDTLPYQGAIIIMLGMADLKHKEGYPPVFMCTVVMTGLGAIVTALLFAMGVGL